MARNLGVESVLCELGLALDQMKLGLRNHEVMVLFHQTHGTIASVDSHPPILGNSNLESHAPAMTSA